MVVNQHNTDNKDSSVNSIIMLFTDKEVIEQLVEIVKNRFEK